MRLPRETYQIQQTIETHLPHFSQPQLAGLVLWVCGAILSGSACQNAVAPAFSPWRKWNNLGQGIDWRRLLLKGHLWNRVWLLPEPWPEPKPNLEVTRHDPA